MLKEYVKLVNSTTARFDSESWLIDLGILSKPLVYLDLRFWVDMADERDAAHKHLKDILLNAVSKGQLLCPLSGALLREMCKRPHARQRISVAQLAERLSQKACLKPLLDLLFAEVTHAFDSLVANDYQPSLMPRSKAYCHVLEFAYPLMLKTENTPLGGAKGSAMASWLLSNIDMPLYELLDYITPFWQDKLRSMIEEYAERTITRMKTTRESVGSPQEMQRIEWEETKRWMAEILFDQLNMVREYHGASFPSQSTLKTIVTSMLRTGLLESCPTLLIGAQICASIRWDSKPFDSKDVFDIEHARAPLPYVDCIALDKYYRHLTKDVLKLHKEYQTQITSDIDELIAWVESTSSTSTSDSSADL